MQRKILLPAPLDRSVAALRLSTRSNDITSFFDVQVSAFFGTNKVKIPIKEGGSLEVTCRIRRALIQFHWLNCDLQAISGLDSISGQFETTEIKHNASTGKINTGGLKAALAPVLPKWLRLGAEISTESTNSTNGEETSIKKAQQVHFAGSDAIIIQKNSDGSPLRGSIVSETTFGRFTPRSVLDTCLVAAEVLVAENWMDYLDPRPIDLRPDLARRWEKHGLKPKSQSDMFHRDAFRVLISHLITRGLQRDEDSPFATLCMDAVIAAPHESDGDLLLSLAHIEQAKTIGAPTVSFDKLLDVVESSPSNALAILRNAGVSEESISRLSSQHKLGNTSAVTYIEDVEKAFENSNNPTEYGIVSTILSKKKIVTVANVVLDVINTRNEIADGSICSFRLVNGSNSVVAIGKRLSAFGLMRDGTLIKDKDFAEWIQNLIHELFAQRGDSVFEFDTLCRVVSNQCFAPEPFWLVFDRSTELNIQKINSVLGYNIFESRDTGKLLISNEVPRGAAVSTPEIRAATFRILSRGQGFVKYADLALELSKELGVPAKNKKELGISNSWRTIFENDKRFIVNQHGVSLSGDTS